MPNPAIKIGIIGAAGYTGMELLRLLISHPKCQIVAVSSETEKDNAVAEIIPSLLGQSDLVFVGHEDTVFSSCDIVFIAAPEGVAMQHAPALLAAGVKVIDLSADFRLRDLAIRSTWYKTEHSCPNLLPEAVYGLPEQNREHIRSARLIANPGCYPTAVILGILPLLRGGLIEIADIIVDAKSGISGAGRRATINSSFCEVAESFRAYNASGHRHLPEMLQALQQEPNGAKLSMSFVPHLLPIVRGIEASIYLATSDPDALVKAQDALQRSYCNEPFVRVLPLHSHPNTGTVRSSNFCHLAVHQAPQTKRLIVLSVIDNLVKGAAGQAIQNMNLICGLDETTGLQQISNHP